MLYVGVDVGKRKCRAAMMNQEGEITGEFDFSNDSEGISWLSSMLMMDDRVVMESTGAYWLDLQAPVSPVFPTFRSPSCSKAPVCL